MCSPDGKWLVYAGFDCGKFVAKKVSVDGGASDAAFRGAAHLRLREHLAGRERHLAFQTQPTTGGAGGNQDSGF